jgi:hypothetical protein
MNKNKTEGVWVEKQKYRKDQIKGIKSSEENPLIHWLYILVTIRRM